MKKRRISLALVFSLILLTAFLAMAAQSAQMQIPLPTGAYLRIWLKNQLGRDTTDFNYGDRVDVVTYSSTGYSIRIDADLIYPQSIYPPKILARNLIVSRSGAGQDVPLSYNIDPNDPEGVYIIRLNIWDAASGAFIGQIDLKFRLGGHEETCVEGEEVCRGSALYRCVGGKWQLVESCSMRCGCISPLLTAVAIVVIVAVVGLIAYLLLRRPSPPPKGPEGIRPPTPAPPPPPARPPPPKEVKRPPRVRKEE